MNSQRAELLSELRAHGILHADAHQPVVGRNGEHAAWMLYAWPLTMASETLAMIAHEMLRLIDPFEATLLAANGYGAVPLMSAMVLEGAGRYQGTVVRPERKQHGAVRRIDGAGDTSKRVVIVDDSISSGTSFREACKALEEHGYDVEGTACLVDFPHRGGRERAEAQGYRVATLFDVCVISTSWAPSLNQVISALCRSRGPIRLCPQAWTRPGWREGLPSISSSPVRYCGRLQIWQATTTGAEACS